MTVLVAGASGLLGGSVVATARERGERVRGTYLTDDPTTGPDGAGVFDGAGVETVRFDVTGGSGGDDADLEALLAGVDRVVDCVGLADPDACETDPVRARAVNADWPGRLAAPCADRGLPLCHVSTDYVFDGRDPPYVETDDSNPLQTYGETKLAGERAVRDAGGGRWEPLVLRVSFLGGSTGRPARWRGSRCGSPRSSERAGRSRCSPTSE